MYQKRDYRKKYAGSLVFRVISQDESDLAIGLPAACWEPGLTEALQTLLKDVRLELGQYLAQDPLFLTSHQPHGVPANAPPLAQEMSWAGEQAGVGPMAAVAGAIAARVGYWLHTYSDDVIVENGGDIYLSGTCDKTVGIYAGEHSPFTGKLAVKIPRHLLPLGICTSSGTVGPSFSYGQADAAVILAKNTALADAVATATANRIQTPDDLVMAAEFAVNISGVLGVLVLKDDKMAALGEIQLTPVV